MTTTDNTETALLDAILHARAYKQCEAALALALALERLRRPAVH